jgi:hypothetical protein
MPWGGRAQFVLKGKNNQTIKKESGTVICSPFQLRNSPLGDSAGYPNYDVVTVSGMTEILEQKRPEPTFYVTDDAAVWNQYKSIGCG